MITENLSTLKIHKLSQAQYDRELAAGNIDGDAIYLTPEEQVTLLDLGVTATASELNYVDGVTSNIQTQLDNKATIDEIASLYIWKKYDSSPNGISETTSKNVQIDWKLDTIADEFNVRYADSFSTDGKDISLINEQTLSIKTTNDASGLCGKYIYSSGTILSGDLDSNEGYYFIPTDATFTITSDALMVSHANKLFVPKHLGYVTSRAFSDYTSGVQHTDGYWYEYVKQIGDSAVVDNSNINFTETDPTVPAWAKSATKPTYTASEVGALPDTTVIPTVPTNVSAFINDAGYLTQHQSLDAYAKTADLGALATKDSLTASDVGALPDTTKIPSTLSDLTADSTHRTVTDTEKNTWNAKANVSDIPTKVSNLTNDKGYITGYTETDPTVPSWAKAATKPSYTASEVGALPADTVIPTVPTNVSAFTNDVGYLTEHQSLDGLATETYANTAVSNHNTNNSSHNDIRDLISGLTTRLNALADSDDTTLDQMSEVVAYIKSNKTLIEQVTTNKVNVSDIINNITTNVSNKPLSAAQGVALKALIDAIVVPTKVSELTNDKGYLTSVPSEYITETELDAKGYLTDFTETDPTVPAWAKAASKPTYTKSEIGLGNVDNTSDANKPVSTAQAAAILDAKTNDVSGNAFQRVYGSMIPYGTSIAASSDLNTADFLKVGNYYCSKNADVETLTNCPTSLAFMMQVYSPLSTTIDNETTKGWVYRLRKLITHKGIEYYQFVNSGSTAGTFTYGEWVKTANDSDLAKKADKTSGIFYIEGGGTTDTTNKVATWTGSHKDIAKYYDGLMIAYKVGTAGSTTTTLNINDLGAVTVVRNATTAVSTAYGINAIVFLTYTTDSSGTSYWKVADYDSDTKTRSSNKTGTKMYLIGAASQSTSGQTTYSNSNCYIGTDNCLYSSGKKVANASDIPSTLKNPNALTINGKVYDGSEAVNITIAGGGVSENNLLGQTPMTFDEAVSVKLVGEGTHSYTIAGKTVADLSTMTASGTNAELVEHEDYIELKSTGGSAWYSSYATLSVDGLTVGTAYVLVVQTTANGNLANGVGAGHYIVKNSSGSTLATLSGAVTDIAGTHSIQFTANTTSIKIDCHISDYYFSNNCKSVHISDLYINEAADGTTRTDIINKSGTFIDSYTIGTVLKGVTVTTSPSCEVYAISGDNNTDSASLPLAGKKIVCFGDSLFGMYTGDTSVSAYVAKRTGATVYNVGFGGCRMSVHPYTGYNEFCMYALADAVASGNWSLQDTAASSGSSNFPDQLAILKSIDFSDVDAIVIHYGTNDFTGGSGVTIDNTSNTKDCNTLCGAMRHSIETLLTAFPELRIFISLPAFRTDVNTNSSGKKLTDYVDAIAATAKEYNLPIIDSYYGLGINAINATTFLEDGVHHNIVGRKRFGNFIGSRMIAEY